jgi:mono/diheme cytochrome c family protein
MTRGVNGMIAGLAITLALLTQTDAATQAPAPASTPAQTISRERAIVNQYCVTCHNTRMKTANLDLSAVDVNAIADHAEIGEKVVRKLRAGMMPPVDMPRPDAASREFLASSLEAQLDRAAAAKPTYTPPGPHRLNRREYANAIHDLLGLDVDPGAFLPVDDTSDGFDNIAGALNTSPALVEAYVSAAGKISRLALGHELATTQKSYLVPSDYSQTRHVEGESFGTRGGLIVNHYFPADGTYAFNWTPVRSNAGGLHGDAAGEQLELTVDGERVTVWAVDKQAPRNAADLKYEVRVPVKAGLKKVELAFINRNLVPSDDLNEYFDRAFHLPGNVGGFTFAPHVNALIVTGPFEATKPEHTASRDRILICQPAAAADEAACAKKILTGLATKAFRHPVASTELDAVMAEYEEGRAGHDFEAGIERGLQMILADPAFVYRTEAAPVAVKAGVDDSYAVSDIELASRLSFFLWSTIPDDELRTVASQGKLRSPGMLEKQVKRMLADPRSKEFVSNFAGQWLQLRNLQSAARVGELYPNFDDNIRQAFRIESEMFFGSIVNEDRNVVDLLTADYTFVDERLAKYYGIPDVFGSRFRRVQLGPELDMRRGLLGKGSMLTVTANADRTSPVRRGKWVLINILGVIPPDPPPNVPAFKESDSSKPAPATMRDRMEAHRVSPTCATCHKMMDPLGFALEVFDAAGAYRTSEGTHKLDLTGNLVDGTKFNGPSELRQALLAYSPRFVETLTERLMTYALGRGVQYYDMPVVRQIVKDAATKDNHISALILGIVKSKTFQRNQVASAVTASR